MARRAAPVVRVVVQPAPQPVASMPPGLVPKPLQEAVALSQRQGRGRF